MENKRQNFRRHDDYINNFCREAFISSLFAIGFIVAMIFILPKCKEWGFLKDKQPISVEYAICGDFDKQAKELKF